MAKNTTDNFLRINVMATANSDGRMEENMKEIGLAENNTAPVFTEMVKVKSAEVNGLMVEEYNG